MPPVSGIGTPPSVPPPSGGHEGHGTNAVAPNAGTGQSFSSALAQAISQAPGSGGHDGHSGGNGGMAASPANTTPHSGGHGANTETPSGGTNPRHFPIGESNHGSAHGIQETVLGLRAYRQQLIASNIANADTPGYKAIDIDFREAVRIAQTTMQDGSVGLALTDGKHIVGSSTSTFQNIPLKYHTEYQSSVDGNTVDMDVERAKFAENAVMYEFSLDRVKGHGMMMMEMLKNLPY